MSKADKINHEIMVSRAKELFNIEALEKKYAMPTEEWLSLYSHYKHIVRLGRIGSLAEFMMDHGASDEDVEKVLKAYIICLDGHKRFLDMDKAIEDFGCVKLFRKYKPYNR